MKKHTYPGMAAHTATMRTRLLAVGFDTHTLMRMTPMELEESITRNSEALSRHEANVRLIHERTLKKSERRVHRITREAHNSRLAHEWSEGYVLPQRQYPMARIIGNGNSVNLISENLDAKGRFRVLRARHAKAVERVRGLYAGSEEFKQAAEVAQKTLEMIRDIEQELKS